MLEVLRLMMDGWELGHYSGMDGHWVIQEGGIGKSGKAKYPHSSTGFGLLKRNLITSGVDRFPVTIYHITPAGRKALET